MLGKYRELLKKYEEILLKLDNIPRHGVTRELQGTPIDESVIGDGKVLVYRSATKKLGYEILEGLVSHDRAFHVSPTLPIDDVHVLDVNAHHREWGAFEEPSWTKVFRLPNCGQYGVTKKGSVFQPASPPAWDSVFVSHPSIIRIRDLYYLFYAGGSQKTFPDYIGIGVASFVDPEGPYTRLKNGNRIIEAPLNTVYACPSVIYDVYETDPDKRWKMWFLRVLYSWNVYATMYSYSANPEGPWSSPVWIPELSDPAWEPYYGASFLKFGSLYYALVPKFADKKLYCWTSKEPNQNWTNRGVVLDLGAGGQWDDTQIRYVGATYINGVVYCLYSGLGGSPSRLRIGLACASGNNLFSYTKFALNPSINIGSVGQFDETHVFAPCLIQVEDSFFIWYTAVNPTDRQIGLATIP